MITDYIVTVKFILTRRLFQEFQLFFVTLCTSQSKSRPPPPGKGGDIGQKNLKKGANGPSPRATFSFQWPRFPLLPVKVYAEVPIFIWFKMFQTSLVFHFLYIKLSQVKILDKNWWRDGKQELRIKQITKQQVSYSRFSPPFWLRSGLVPVSLQHA